MAARAVSVADAVRAAREISLQQLPDELRHTFALAPRLLFRRVPELGGHAGRRCGAFRRAAVYEPGVSRSGSMPTGWLAEYRRRLAAGDPRGAFAVMARGAGHAPAILARMPLGLVRAMMYCQPKSQWHQLEPLLPTALAENEQIASLDAPTAGRFASLTARVLLVGGTDSPAAITTRTLRALHEVVPGSQLELLDGLQHTAPEKAPVALAEALVRFLHPSDDPTTRQHPRPDGQLPTGPWPGR